MSRCRPPCTESGYDNLGGGGGGGSSITWNTVTLSGASLLQDPLSGISSASYGAVSSVTLASGDIGDIRGPGSPFTPDCPFWTWTISDTFNYTTNAQVLVQAKLTGTPNDQYFFYMGVYDGTAPLSGINQGIYAGVRVDVGNTKVANVGTIGSNGTAAASYVASGGNLCAAFNLDQPVPRARDGFLYAKSNTGPAYGEQSNGSASPGNWAGAKMHGFMAMGTTASRAGGTFAGIELRWATVQSF